MAVFAVPSNISSVVRIYGQNAILFDEEKSHGGLFRAVFRTDSSQIDFLIFFSLHTIDRMLKSRYVFTGMYYRQRELMQNRWRISKMTF